MPSQIRMNRINERMREELSELLLMEVSDPRLTGVNVTEVKNTVTVSDDGSTVTVTTGAISQDTFNALVNRVTALESTNYLVLQDGN